jgi:hypothetical protein
MKGLGKPEGDLNTAQKSAAGIVVHAVGEAREALPGRKAESTVRPIRERWMKAQTVRSGK